MTAVDLAAAGRGPRGASPKVLIVSVHFPPSSLAGVHRARHLAKHLPAHGWRPTVLCVDEAYHEEALDPRLARLVPESVEVVRAGAIPARFTRPFGVGDLALRAFPMLRRQIFRCLAREEFGAVLITGFPFYPMIMAGAIKRRFGVPIVLDFQDPWVSAWGAQQPRLSKAGIVHALSLVLERRCVRQADFITSVSQIQNEEMLQRYPALDAERMAAIPIGGDPEDFSGLRDLAPGPGAEVARSTIDLCYVGTIWPRAEPTLRIVFRGLRRLREQMPQAARIRLNFLGTSSQSGQSEAYCVMPIAAEEGVAAAVTEAPARVSYLDALARMARADGLLVIGSNEPHYTASKIFPVLMSGKPYMSLLHTASSAHQILQAAGGGLALAFDQGGNSERTYEDIATALRTLAFNPRSIPPADARQYSQYEASAIAARYATIFDFVSSKDNLGQVRR